MIGILVTEKKNDHMEDESMEPRDIKSMGDIRLESGEYGDIISAGDLKINGSVKANFIKAAGDLKAKEEIEVVKISVFGDAKFKKAVKADDASIYGDAEFQDKLTGTEIRIFGSLSAVVVDAEKMTVNGEIDKASEINAEELTLNGEFHVDGAMNIGHGRFNLAGDSRVKEIFCEQLEVKVSKDSFQGILSGLLSRTSSGRLKVDLIEGDDIFLEHTTADIVRGKIVRIGEGSKIGKVEYSDTLEIFEGGTVEVKEEF